MIRKMKHVVPVGIQCSEYGAQACLAFKILLQLLCPNRSDIFKHFSKQARLRTKMMARESTTVTRRLTYRNQCGTSQTYGIEQFNGRLNHFLLSQRRPLGLSWPRARPTGFLFC